MNSLEDFKKENPALWKAFGPGYEVVAVLYFLENEKGLTKKELSEEIRLSEGELEKGLCAMQQTNEILFKENTTGRRYYLEAKTRKAFERLYNL